MSPDGKWLAYESDESGQLEVFVRPFPDVQAGRWQISFGGGVQPAWNPAGHELFFVAPPLPSPPPDSPPPSSPRPRRDGPPPDRPSITVVLNWAAELKRVAAPGK